MNDFKFYEMYLCKPILFAQTNQSYFLSCDLTFEVLAKEREKLF